MLHHYNFDPVKTEELIQGFLNGFDIGYRGPLERMDTAENIPFTVGTPTDMWEKIMKEIKLGRTAGPFAKIPYKHFMQSPVGLVPKAGGQTRMIFHLSYDFADERRSLNFYTPREECTVTYNDLDYAVKTCRYLSSVHWSQMMNDPDNEFLNEHQIFFAKSDLRSAFKILPILPSQRCFLIYKAKHPVSGRTYWFVEKTLPFGASVSCKRFQLFSESLKHIVEHQTGNFFQVTNYLDDFLFVARTDVLVNQMVRDFLNICSHLGVPVALDKTEWGTTQIVFLGILLDGRRHCLMVPDDKIQKALRLLQWVRNSSKLTIKIIQKLTGTLNFLSRAIIPGRTFTRSLYDKLKKYDSKGRMLKSYHHVNLNKTFKSDCEVWEYFLTNATLTELCRPFVDLDQSVHSVKLHFATDATLNPDLGMGGIFAERWFAQKWNKQFILENNPSICYLELFALVTAILLWGDRRERATQEFASCVITKRLST